MPKRADLKKIMIIGAGPIVIGQACEFDYSGTQACKALKKEGYAIVLVNSNPATIMTDPEFADRTYLEPIRPDIVARIIEKERPDALLPTVGGQTALNCALDLAALGVLEKYRVELIGAGLEAIRKAEDRKLFKDAMQKIGLDMPRSKEVYSLEEAREFIKEINFPAIIRPSFTLGGTGGGIAYNDADLERIVGGGLELSPAHQVLLEESIIGWKEIELEVMRDRKDNAVIICSIENLDPMGIHTGDSITIAPVQTLTDVEYQRLRDRAIAVLREVGVSTGGSNVQFALDPKSGRICIIEMNPRVSRSSALASKATGFPIAKIAALLAVGYTLDEIPNDITKVTPASFEPTIDYVVAKIPRFAFEKFRDADDTLNTQMKSVGECMAIGRTFKEAMRKALRSLEISPPQCQDELLEEKLSRPNCERVWYVLHAFRRGYAVERVHELSGIDKWFLHQLAELAAETPEALAAENKARGVKGVVYKKVDTCGAEFEAQTPYLYSTHEQEDEAAPTDREKIIILGGGPNRIGQGIEFDYCCVHASFALRAAGYETIMVNSNPETVSTDYDTSDRLYFEPLTHADVLNIVKTEKPAGLIVQYGGQTPLKLSLKLEAAGARIIGTTPRDIDVAEDRKLFGALMDKLGIKQPPNGTATSIEQAVKAAVRITYPVMVRPSYVLGGRAMEIVYDEAGLRHYMKTAVEASPEHPVLIDKFLEDAVELDVDAISDGRDTVIAGILEHVEEAGIHSGDSASVLPTFSLSPKLLKLVEEHTEKMAAALKVVGLMNVQYAVKNGEVYVLEVNPRASRTVPFVSKATGVPWAKLGALVMTGRTLRELKVKRVMPEYWSVKEAVLPFAKFQGQDIMLSPEMRSTGEVMGIDENFGIAYAKSQIAAGEKLPEPGQKIFISVTGQYKNDKLLWAAHKYRELGFGLICTKGTGEFLRKKGLEVNDTYKIREGHPNITDLIANHEIGLIVNTPSGKGARQDDYYIRQAGLRHKTMCVTTVAAAIMVAKGLDAILHGQLDVKALQDYHRELKKSSLKF
ncbi:MAG: carbamoyl-phosphate synthase large subunit [Candidatus Margulisbacteria bacterium]|jgi:carbamoyl-phosphate synthase large subunit|nr:carbamoyl-phosphate synthase large subunit [Candidatus Margulisiibacteriota bacterium]